MIVIDTSLAIGFLQGNEETISRIKAIQEENDIIGMSVVSLFELLHPLRHRKLRDQERIARSFIHQLSLLALDQDAVEASAEIMGSLMRTGQAVNALDVLIAGTARACGADLILSNDEDFERIGKITDLKVEIMKNG